MTQNYKKLYRKPWSHFSQNNWLINSLIFIFSLRQYTLLHTIWSMLCYRFQVTWTRLKTNHFYFRPLLMQPIKKNYATYLQWQYSISWTSPTSKFQSSYKKCLLNMWLVGVTCLINLYKKSILSNRHYLQNLRIWKSK